MFQKKDSVAPKMLILAIRWKSPSAERISEKWSLFVDAARNAAVSPSFAFRLGLDINATRSSSSLRTFPRFALLHPLAKLLLSLVVSPYVSPSPGAI
jgi:hypothetical protein